MSHADDLALVIERTGNRTYAEPGWEHLVAALARRFRREAGTPEPELPGRARMAANAAGAAGRAAAAVVTGSPVMATPDLRDARLAVCRSGAGLTPEQTAGGHCNQWRPSDDRCAACGCYLGGVVGKAAAATEDCPLGRWPAPRSPPP